MLTVVKVSIYTSCDAKDRIRPPGYHCSGIVEHHDIAAGPTHPGYSDAVRGNLGPTGFNHQHTVFIMNLEPSTDGMA